jgi:hypothetical protein
MLLKSILASSMTLLIAMPLLAGAAAAEPRDHDRGGDRGFDRGPPDRGPTDRGGDWELLGEQKVGFGVDHDTIRVGRQEGRYSKIALEVRDSDVEMLSLKVFFVHGPPQDVPVREFIRKGQRTRPLDLIGDARGIDRIELVYKSRPSFHGRATVAVYGEKAVQENWELLGEKKVDRRVDRDVIPVGRKEGRFNKIRLEVKDNDVEIQDLKVFFHRGAPQDVAVRERIREGGRTRAIDLIGDDRVIDRIELVYRTRGRGERATVAVYGLQSGGAPDHRDGDHRDGDHAGPGDHWEELGCQKVGFGADHDVINVGRREGRFSAIRLRVERSDVLILSLKVEYEHGPVDAFDVKSHIRAGSETRPLDLRGERRAIKQVDLVYSSIPSFKGAARLCVDGRQ